MNGLLRSLNNAFAPRHGLPDPDRATVRPVWGTGRPWKPTALLRSKRIPWTCT